MIEGLSHITFVVSDLDQMANFLKTIFDAQEVYCSGEKFFSISREKFFSIGGVWVVAMEGVPLSAQTYNHLAFKIADSEFENYVKRVELLGVKILEGRSRIKGEGRSLYFYDYDNHLFELHTGTLQQRLERYHKGM
jgi:fosfomycin resistance protein FosX